MAKSTAKNMTSGNIPKLLIMFALPLMVGNIFQMLYNTVDSIVVGNYVSTQALAAVGSTTTIINMLVFFFNGFSIGAGVVIGQYFGARNIKKLHTVLETTIAATFVLCVIFTIIGMSAVKPMLRFMSTPEDVFGEAVVYLRIYFAGIGGLLIYNIGSGILRAVGDTKRPLYFLMLTSVLNIILDLFFVVVLHMGIEGVAFATVIAQFISAGLTLLLLTRTNDIYKLVWKDLTIDFPTLGQIFSVGLPTGIQSVITAFSNTFVQAYVNSFGSSVMAGWSCYNKIDQVVMLMIQSMAMGATTFVSQNVGANQVKRANKGTFTAIFMSMGITVCTATLIFIFAPFAVGLFTDDSSVIKYGVLFIHTNVYFLLFNVINQVMAGALRGRGDAKGPMVIMLSSFVAFRQLYLYVMTHFIVNSPRSVGISYPVGWMFCSVVMLTYFYFRWIRNGQLNTVKVI